MKTDERTRQDEQERGTCEQADVLEKQTKPPARYSEASLLRDMETAGKQIETAPEGIATRKGDPLGAQINNAIQALYLNHKMNTILAKWQAAQFALKNQ